VAPDLEQMVGRYLQQARRSAPCRTRQLELRGTIEQGESQLMFANAEPHVLVRLVSRFDGKHEMVATNLRRYDQAAEELRTRRLDLAVAAPRRSSKDEKERNRRPRNSSSAPTLKPLRNRPPAARLCPRQSRRTPVHLAMGQKASSRSSSREREKYNGFEEAMSD